MKKMNNKKSGSRTAFWNRRCPVSKLDEILNCDELGTSHTTAELYSEVLCISWKKCRLQFEEKRTNPRSFCK